MTEFEWDPRKAITNRSKHKILFEDAKSAFNTILEETLNSTVDGEDRWQIIGISRTGLILKVIYTIRANGEIIRIISARPLTPKERREDNEHR